MHVKIHRPMKRTQIALLSAAAAVMAFALMSSSSGVAEIQNRNRTGEPGTDATCNQCHGGGSFGATTAINVLDPNSGAAVSEYLPGEQYVLEIAIGGTSPRFGMQATAVDAAGGNAGSFGNPSNNTQLEDVGGRHIIEHNSRARRTRSPWIGRHPPRRRSTRRALRQAAPRAAGGTSTPGQP